MSSCPHASASHRRTGRADDAGPAIESADGVWRIRSFDLAREVLRAGSTTVQAGFNVDQAREGMRGMRDPVLYMDGPEHKRQRSMIARYFAPATVAKNYQELMERRADRLVEEAMADLQAGRTVSVSDLALRYSVEVAARVIGLTESDPDGLSRRLERLFSTPAHPPRPRIAEDDEAEVTRRSSEPSLRDRAVSLAGRFAAVGTALKSSGPAGVFYLKDVRPAIQARRAQRQEDVVSHLLDQGYSDAEILTECLTYGAAGMVTTREFIGIVTWHLLEDDALRERYLAAETDERYDILHEILRLEPVVGRLYRRATEEIVLTDGDTTHRIPEGAVLDLSIRAANADPDAVGDDPLSLCPARSRARGVRAEALSFGDGNHRCPGNALAIQETDVLLTRLLRLPLKQSGQVRIDWLDLIAGYEIRDLHLARA